MTAFESAGPPTLFAALGRKRRWTAFPCAGSYVVANETGHEVLTLSRTDDGLVSAHAVEPAYEWVAIAIDREDVPWGALVAHAGTQTPTTGEDALTGDYDAQAAAEALGRRWAKGGAR